MDRFPAPSFMSAVESGACGCAVAFPELVGADEVPADVRIDLVQRCRALIDDGLYETDQRIDAAVARLAERMR